MKPRDTQRLGDSLGNPEKKRRFNEWVFSLIAPEYDFITRPLSLWRDAAWKRWMIHALPDRTRPHCVDLACGTGDICFLLQRRYPDGLVAGVDLTSPMLRLARDRDPAGHINFLRQDMNHLGFQDSSIDIVTGSYALRNAPDLHPALQEISRVLKPGGLAAFLDFSKSPRRVPQAVGYWILKIWGSFWGFVLHGNPEVYSYIAESLRCFPDRPKLRKALEENRLSVVGSSLFFFGLIECLILERLAD